MHRCFRASGDPQWLANAFLLRDVVMLRDVGALHLFQTTPEQRTLRRPSNIGNTRT